jgi:hypothetical protein
MEQPGGDAGLDARKRGEQMEVEQQDDVHRAEDYDGGDGKNPDVAQTY